MPSYEDQGAAYDPHGATFENVGRRKTLKVRIPSAKPNPVQIDTSAEDMFRRQNPGR